MSEYTIQRFRGGYAIVYHDEAGARRREKLAATDRAGAESEARQRWRLGDQSEKTVGNIIAAYQADREANGTVSVGRMRDAWKAMRPFWDAVRPDLIDAEMAQSYAEQRLATPAPDSEKLREALTRIRRSMVLLQQNSEGCALNHYGDDAHLHGMPGWLTDTKADVQRLTDLLAALGVSL